MQTTYTHNGKIYTLSNEGLVEGDKVFPIAFGHTENGKWIHEDFRIEQLIKWNEFPDEPHTIEDLHYSDFKPYEIRTDYGFGPIEKYYKIINTEEVKEESNDATE